MNRLSIIVLIAVAICSCYGISDRRIIRSTSEISAEANPLITAATAPQDSAPVETSDIFTARGKNKGGKHGHKMEAMHMGLTYIKMVISTLMSAIGHIFAFKAVGLTLISVLIQVAQFVMMLKKDKESHPPTFIHSKVVENPYHSPQPDPYGAYGGHGKSSDAYGGYGAQYTAPRSSRRRR